jgi:endonuclease/exonuclease/phosphatase family metal-dependent hydrolase
VNYNMMHGLYDEDPRAPDFDRFADRLALQARELSVLKPDILVLQEFANSQVAGYPDVRVVLMDALGPDYRMVFGEAGSTRINEGTLGRMTITRLPVVSAANRPIFQGRSAHRVTVQTKGGVIDIYNVHLEGPELVGHQELEVVRLLTFIDSAGRNQNPVILAGDFNSRPGDAALVRVAQLGFRDVAAEKYDVTCEKAGDPGCTRATAPSLVNNLRNLADIRIDYMFVRGGLDIDLKTVSAAPFLNRPLQTESRELLWVSDHIGIQATFEVVRQPALRPGARLAARGRELALAVPLPATAPRAAFLRREDEDQPGPV